MLRQTAQRPATAAGVLAALSNRARPREHAGETVSDDATFLARVVLRNYKSVAECDVQLGPLTFLVGPNGAGKSNFLDALRFVADALRVSLEHALRDRGGLKEVRRRSGGHPTHFAMRLEFVLPSGARGHYAFRNGLLQSEPRSHPRLANARSR